MILEKIRSTVESFNLNISEEELLNYLKNTKRWPQKYPWGQPSVEIINNIGTRSVNFYKAHAYSNQCYLDFDKWYKYYDLGYTSIISNVFDLNDGLRDAPPAPAPAENSPSNPAVPYALLSWSALSVW